MTTTARLGPWPAGMNMRAHDASLGTAARLLVNVDLDDTGRVSARRGKTLALPLAGAHSLTSFNGRLYGVQSGRVFSWVPGDATPTYGTAVGKAVMQWDVLNGELYGVSPTGLVRYGADHTQLPWGQAAETVDADGVRYTAPVPADNMIVFISHILFVHGAKISWTPAFQPQVVAPHRDFVVMPETVRMIAPVDTGVWVASDSHTWFLQGRNPSEWVSRRVEDLGALGAAYAGRDNVVYWLTERGFAIGNEQGQLSLPQEDNVALRCAEEPAILRAPWRPELFISTLPQPSTAPQTFDGFIDAATLKGV